jgi:hypothetical protein
MMLIVIGESVKNLDKTTDGTLLPRYPEVDWKGAKGVRDVISHHYMDLNAEVIFDICQTFIPPLIVTIGKMRQEIAEGSVKSRSTSVGLNRKLFLSRLAVHEYATNARIWGENIRVFVLSFVDGATTRQAFYQRRHESR